MADFEEEAFGLSNGGAAAAVPSNGDFFGEAPTAAPAPSGGSGGGFPPPADADLFYSSDAPAAVGGSFGSSGGGAPTAAFMAPPMESDDPRVAWARKNAEVLAEKAKAEAAAKQEQLDKAQAHLRSVQEEHDARLTKRRQANREAEQVSDAAHDSVPKGNTPWERAISIVNFNAEAPGKDPFKELSRFKAVLLAAKAANISVHTTS